MTTMTPNGGYTIHCTTRDEMTNEQETHLQAIKDQFAREVDAKYRAGVAEHGGNLWELSTLALIEEGMREAVDQYVYLATARNQILNARSPKRDS